MSEQTSNQIIRVDFLNSRGMEKKNSFSTFYLQDLSF